MRRPVLPGDVTAVARALLAVEPAQREVLCSAIFSQADSDCHSAGQGGFGKGDGTLSAAARQHRLADEPTLDNPEYLRCTIRVLHAVLERVSQQAAAG